MDGQVWGGGVIVLVAVVLWLVYLLPSWQGRHRYNASERNAVRLSQALRVLAETSETPEEVRLELSARTALAQQKLARRAQAEIVQQERDRERAELERVKAEQQAAHARALAETELQRQRALAEAQRARAEAERARAEALAASFDPVARRARARRRARLLAAALAVAGLALAGWGVALMLAQATWIPLAAGLTIALLSVGVLQRMAQVQRRSAIRVGVTVAADVTRRADVQDVPLADERAAWTPRDLPRPLTASAGSRAAAVLDGAAAREALRHAAVDEAIRERAERAAPPSIDSARKPAPAATGEPDFRRMGYVDDAAIEDHVRSLLARRAVGQ